MWLEPAGDCEEIDGKDQDSNTPEGPSAASDLTPITHRRAS